MENKRTKFVVIIMIAVVGILPLLGYTWYFWQVPVLDAEESLLLLNDPQQNFILVDVRNIDEYKSSHIEGALNYPLGSIENLQTINDIDPRVADKAIILICSSDFRSASAAKKFISLGYSDVTIVQGGMQSWVKAAANYPDLQYSQIVKGDLTENAIVPMPMWEQIAAVVSGFGFKPLHMILSIVLVVILLRETSPDLRILGWGLLIFFISEVACAVNYLFFDHTSYLAEYIHSYGMVIAFSFSIFAFLEGVDARIFKFSVPNKRCAFLDLCKGCAKTSQVECKARYIFMFAIGLIAIMSFFPLLAQPANTSYNTSILGSSYNYCRLLLYQYYESRFLPVVSLIMCGLAFYVFIRKSDEAIPMFARIFMSAAFGAWGFSFLRLVFGIVFQNALIWADFWEEITELLFVGFVMVVLWIFRGTLFNKPQDRTNI